MPIRKRPPPAEPFRAAARKTHCCADDKMQVGAVPKDPIPHTVSGIGEHSRARPMSSPAHGSAPQPRLTGSVRWRGDREMEVRPGRSVAAPLARTCIFAGDFSAIL